MNRLELMLRARSLVRDFTNSFFREQDIVNYLNEGIERVMQIIPELKDMTPFSGPTDEVKYLPRQYHHLLAVYCASRLASQDERHFQAGNFMNEFETKLDTLKASLLNGEIEIIDPVTGEPIDSVREEYVVNRYFDPLRSDDW